VSRRGSIAFAVLACGVLSAGLSGSAQAQRIGRLYAFQGARAGRMVGVRRDGHHAGDWLRRYKDLPPDQQEKALANDPDFQRLSPEHQERLRQRLRTFNTLPPEQQRRILERMETWEHLTPDQKDKARNLFHRIRQLAPERRRAVMKAVRQLRSMPPEQRQPTIDSQNFKSSFSDEERDLLGDIAELPLAPGENGKDPLTGKSD
jgi:uncharacterized protein DUF3106